MGQVSDRPGWTVLHDAARHAGIDVAGATLIRDGANTLYRVGDVVARIGRPGTADTAAREVAVARWLNARGVPAAQPHEGLPQPTQVADRPVTWWHLLPDHRPATPGELGSTLARLHALQVPAEPALPRLDPLAGLDRLDKAATSVAPADHDWLSGHLERMRAALADLPATRDCVVHGDAWQGNVAVPDGGGPVLLDLDHVAVGPPQWDLIALAVDHTDFGRLAPGEYRSFVASYGTDVTEWPGYRTLADIQELRWVTFALTRAATGDHAAATEARHRIACLRGKHPRPWTWRAL